MCPCSAVALEASSRLDRVPFPGLFLATIIPDTPTPCRTVLIHSAAVEVTLHHAFMQYDTRNFTNTFYDAQSLSHTHAPL